MCLSLGSNTKLILHPKLVIAIMKHDMPRFLIDSMEVGEAHNTPS